MKISSEKIENSQIKLNVEMEQNEVDKYMDQAYQELVSKVAVPGFRKGKTPRSVLETHIGKSTLFQEALEHLIPEVYTKAVEEEKIEPIAYPKIEITKTDPVTFNAVIPVRPEITLGDYKDIRIEYAPPEVDQNQVESALERLMYEKSTLAPTDNPAEFGDVVTMDIEGEEEGKALPLRKDLVYELIKDYPIPLPGFGDNIVGLKRGDEKNISLNYPADYEIKELAGKNYSFKVKINEVKRRELPEKNNELAKSVGSEDLKTLREQIYNELKTRTEQKANSEYEQKIVDKVIEISKLEYPPILVDAEVDSMIEEEARGFKEGITGLENYLKNLNKSLDEHKQELQPIANQRVSRALILSEVTKAEAISVDDSEIEAEIDRISSQNETQSEEMKKMLSSPEAKNSINQLLTRQKTIERVKQIAGGKLN